MSFNNPSWYTRFELEILQHHYWFQLTIRNIRPLYNRFVTNKSYSIDNYISAGRWAECIDVWHTEIGQRYRKRKLEEYLKIHFPFSLPSSHLIQYLLQFL